MKPNYDRANNLYPQDSRLSIDENCITEQILRQYVSSQLHEQDPITHRPLLEIHPFEPKHKHFNIFLRKLC